MSYDFDDDDFDLPIAHRGPVKVFSARHPLGNPQEVEGFLAQGDRWVAKDGPCDISDLTPEHALNAANLVLENALRIAVVRATGGTFAAAASETGAREELLQTELVVALLQRAGTVQVQKPSWA